MRPRRKRKEPTSRITVQIQADTTQLEAELERLAARLERVASALRTEPLLFGDRV